tara:strand:- start:4161 stop:4367 length:207 start_codon:yes stop_codon:yes gene_type:complete
MSDKLNNGVVRLWCDRSRRSDEIRTRVREYAERKDMTVDERLTGSGDAIVDDGYLFVQGYKDIMCTIS